MNLKAENKHKRTREAISTTREISTVRMKNPMRPVDEKQRLSMSNSADKLPWQEHDQMVIRPSYRYIPLIEECKFN